MDINPITALSDYAKQQKLDAKLQELQSDIRSLRGGVTMSKFIELHIVADSYSDQPGEPVSVNASRIAYMQGSHSGGAKIYFTDNTVLLVQETREQILQMTSEPVNESTYIKGCIY